MFVRALLAFTLLAMNPAFAACRNGEVRPPLARYELRGPTALDKRTRLEWQRCGVGQDWSEAEGCTGEVVGLTSEEALSLERDGWRVPTRHELYSLVSSTCEPALNGTVFPGVSDPFLLYWTSTRSRRGFWMVNFKSGTFRAYKGAGMLAPALLVRGGYDRT
jgi:hypothetical protein